MTRREHSLRSLLVRLVRAGAERAELLLAPAPEYVAPVEPAPTVSDELAQKLEWNADLAQRIEAKRLADQAGIDHLTAVMERNAQERDADQRPAEVQAGWLEIAS